MNYIFRQQRSCFSPELKCLRVQLHQTIPAQQETVRHHTYKNFFEIVLSHAVQDYSESLHSLIIELFNFKYLSSNLTHFVNYLNQRYPEIKTPQQLKDSQHNTKLIFQRENSKTYVHNILNLFDPNVRPTVIPPKPSPTTTKRITFKQLGAKITTLAAFSRIHGGKKTCHVK